MRDLQLVEGLDRFLAVSKPSDPLSDDAPGVTPVVPAVRSLFASRERVKCILNLLSHHCLLLRLC
jgi:hypothetical protein